MSKSKIELCILSIMRYEGNADFNIKKVETILSLKQADLQILSEDNYLQKIFQMLIGIKKHRRKYYTIILNHFINIVPNLKEKIVMKDELCELIMQELLDKSLSSHHSYLLFTTLTHNFINLQKASGKTIIKVSKYLMTNLDELNNVNGVDCVLSLINSIYKLLTRKNRKHNFHNYYELLDLLHYWIELLCVIIKEWLCHDNNIDIVLLKIDAINMICLSDTNAQLKILSSNDIKHIILINLIFFSYSSHNNDDKLLSYLTHSLFCLSGNLSSFLQKKSTFILNLLFYYSDFFDNQGNYELLYNKLRFENCILLFVNDSVIANKFYELFQIKWNYNVLDGILNFLIYLLHI